MTASAPSLAASHPPGVTYPLMPAAVQPADLAQPLPSTRRYVLVWKDQLADAVSGITSAQKDFIVTHYVGTQKLFKHQIDEYRQKNPNFLSLVYHLAYGLNGADQSNPVGNITGPDTFGQEDTDTFTPYVAAHSLTRENAYQHFTTPPGVANRVSYPDPYWLMDVSSPEWRSYLFDTLVEWQGYATTKSTGVFLDVAFPPWFDYSPDAWWTEPAGGSSRTALRDFWNPRAKDYFDAMRAAFAKTANHPRYLVIPNTDALVDGTDEPEFLAGTDGVFTENWQVSLASPGDWNLSARRIEKYATSQGKVWMADVTKAGTDLTPSEREQLIGTYLLVRNGTSYIMFGNSDVTWYPEYELDLGGYVDEPPVDLEDLRVAGNGGSEGGLYARKYVSGLVLVNSSDGQLSTGVDRAMKRAQWSGGGEVAADGTLPTFSLTWDIDVAPGTVTLDARTVVILRDAAGPPPPGVEPGICACDGGTVGAGGVGTAGAGGASSASGGATANGGASGASAAGGSTNGAGGAASAPDGGIGGSPSAAKDSGGCGCHTAANGARGSGPGTLLSAVVALVASRRRRRRASVTAVC
ncbi:MAG TPA: putative glycoside hydrolase [Polyangiaceae bacterium]|nr:putative glycoside hydrolase [Polyangiaceae bacterium]